MQKIKNIIVSSVLLIGLITPFAVTSPVFAADPPPPPGSGGRTEACSAIGGSGCSEGAGQLETVIRTAIDILSAIGGIAAVIMIVIGGFKYVTSSGDSQSVGNAKNTIIYSLVGLIVIAFAQVIVQFVLERT